MRLIDGNALYEKTAEWEAQALHMVENTMHDEDMAEWKRWSTILSERSAFEFDVADAPTIDAVPVVRCRECKYSDYATFTPDCTEATFPLKCLSIRYGGVFPDWYCEHGERKDGDEDV